MADDCDGGAVDLLFRPPIRMARAVRGLLRGVGDPDRLTMSSSEDRGGRALRSNSGIKLILKLIAKHFMRNCI